MFICHKNIQSLSKFIFDITPYVPFKQSRFKEIHAKILGYKSFNALISEIKKRPLSFNIYTYISSLLKYDININKLTQILHNMKHETASDSTYILMCITFDSFHLRKTKKSISINDFLKKHNIITKQESFKTINITTNDMCFDHSFDDDNNFTYIKGSNLNTLYSELLSHGNLLLFNDLYNSPFNENQHKKQSKIISSNGSGTLYFFVNTDSNLENIKLDELCISNNIHNDLSINVNSIDIINITCDDFLTLDCAIKFNVFQHLPFNIKNIYNRETTFNYLNIKYLLISNNTVSYIYDINNNKLANNLIKENKLHIPSIIDLLYVSKCNNLSLYPVSDSSHIESVFYFNKNIKYINNNYYNLNIDNKSFFLFKDVVFNKSNNYRNISAYKKEFSTKLNQLINSGLSAIDICLIILNDIKIDKLICNELNVVINGNEISNNNICNSFIGYSKKNEILICFELIVCDVYHITNKKNHNFYDIKKHFFNQKFTFKTNIIDSNVNPVKIINIEGNNHLCKKKYSCIMHKDQSDEIKSKKRIKELPLFEVEMFNNAFKTTT